MCGNVRQILLKQNCSSSEKGNWISDQSLKATQQSIKGYNQTLGPSCSLALWSRHVHLYSTLHTCRVNKQSCHLDSLENFFFFFFIRQLAGGEGVIFRHTTQNLLSEKKYLLLLLCSLEIGRYVNGHCL